MSITAPRNLRSTAITPTSITFAWDAPSSGNATYYKLYHDAAIYSTGVPSPQGSMVTDTTFQITGLVAGREYRCFVWAFDSNNLVSPYIATSIYTLPPGAPTNFRIVATSANTIDVAWDMSEGSINYRLNWTSPYNTKTSGDLGSSVLNYQITGLDASTPYNISLSAYGGSGSATTSLQANTTADPLNLLAPEGLHEISRTAKTLTFGWNSVELATSYAVFYRPVMSINPYEPYQWFNNVSETQCTITGLAANTEYYVRVAAQNNYTQSPTSGPQPGSNLPLIIQTLPIAPTSGFTVQNITSQTASFVWDVNPDAEHYRLVITTAGADYSEKYTAHYITSTSQSATGLVPGYAHLATLWAYTTSSDAGGTATTITFDTLTMPAPANLRFVTGTPTSIAVAWDELTGYVTSGYSLQIAGTGITYNLANTQNVTHTFTQQNNGILPGKFYKVAVKARSGTVGADSLYSDEIFTYSGVVPTPPIPANIRQTSRTATTIGLVWDGSEAAHFYEIFVNGVLALVSETTTAQLAGLQAQTSYSIQVKACNFKNKSILSPALLMSTQSPPTAVALQTPVHLGTNIGLPTTFTWTPALAIEEVASYEIQISKDSDFTNIVFSQNILGSGTSTFVAPGLSGSSQYYWRVRAINTIGNGLWSETRAFNTITLPPSVPVRQSPGSGVITELGVVFTWLPGANATEHRLIVARDSQFQTIVHNITGLSSSASRQYIILENPNQVFYWKIGAINSGGEAWSTTGTLYTENVAITLLPPSSLAFADVSSTVFSYTAKLTWGAIAGALSYKVYYHDGVEQNTVIAPALGGTSSPAAVLNLTRPGKNITAWVTAHGNTGQSLPSASVNIPVVSEVSSDGYFEIIKHSGLLLTARFKKLKSYGVTTNELYYRTNDTDIYLQTIIEPDIAGDYYEVTLGNFLILSNTSYTIKRVAKYATSSVHSTSSLSTLTPASSTAAPEAIAGDGIVSLTWNTIQGASKYYIYIDGRYRITTTSNSATIDGLPNNQACLVAISGYNSAGAYNLSEAVTAISNNLPLPPATFSGFYDIDQDVIRLTWTHVANAAGYKLYYKINQAESWNSTGLIYNNATASSPIDIDNSTTLMADLNNIARGAAYYFGIASQNSEGQAGAMKILSHNITVSGEYLGQATSKAPAEIRTQLANGQIIFTWRPVD